MLRIPFKYDTIRNLTYLFFEFLLLPRRHRDRRDVFTMHLSPSHTSDISSLLTYEMLLFIYLLVSCK